MDTPDFTTLLQTLTVDSRDNGENFLVFDRIEAIRHLLQGSDYQLLKEGKLFLLYGKKPIAGKEIVLISSHIDCVYSRCFCTVEGDFYKGTFDNSLTNAAVIAGMLQGDFDENVVIAFTGDEEKDSGGALGVINYLINQTDCLVRFALVTDVTNEGWEPGAAFSVENDLGIDLFTAHQIVELLAPYLYSYVHAAEPDESWDYDSVHFPTLTLCAPVLGDMHSDAGVLARRKAMPVYGEVLRKMVHLLSMRD